MTMKHWLVLAIALMMADTAWAGSQLEGYLRQCSGINCGAESIRGVHQANEPFLVQVFAREGECLRLDVVTQSQDTAMLLFTSSVNFGVVNDDRDFAGGDTRPLIAVDPLPWTGWYTVAVSYFDWDNRIAKFVLRYGRYPSGNVNCQQAPALAGQQLERMGGDTMKVGVPASGATEDFGQTE